MEKPSHTSAWPTPPHLPPKTPRCLQSTRQMVCCKRRRRMTKKVPEEWSNSPVLVKWSNLDSNILKHILQRIPISDIFLNVSSLCRSWDAVCWDYLFWSRNVFDLSMTGAGLGMVDISTMVTPLSVFRSHYASPLFTNMGGSILMRKLRCIMEGDGIIYGSMESWRVGIKTVILPYDLEISDEHLLYISEKTPCIEHVFLLWPCNLTVSGFHKAVRNWNHVKEIHLGPLNDDLFTKFIGEIGRNCQKQLESLHIHDKGFILDISRALVIAKNLPGLKKLELDSGIVHNSGMASLFNRCLQLEQVYFNGCGMLDYRRRQHVAYEERFRLTWTDDEEGFPNWQVKPIAVGVERLKGYKNKVIMAKYLSSPEYLEKTRAELQDGFTW